MYTVHITPKGTSARRQVGRFEDIDAARAYAEKTLKGYKGATAEVFNEHDGGFPCSTIFIGGAICRA